MNSKLLLILPLAAVVLVSGCTDMSGIPFIGGLFGPPTVKYTNDVVIIRSLEATPSTVFPGQTVRLTAYIQNQGKEAINDGVFVDLYDYCQGTFNLVETDCGGSKGPDSSCSMDKMYPFETREIRWTLKADDKIKLETTCPMDGVKVLVNYHQKTDGLSTISLIKYEEMQRQMSEGTYKEKTSFRAVGEGPIKGYITVEDKQPVPVSSEGDSTTVISLQLKNEGNGFLAFEPGYAPEKQNEKPVVSMETVDMGGIGEIQVSSSDDQNCGKLTSGGDIELILKESPKIVCPVKLTQKEFTKEISTIMKFSMTYNYEFRASAKITVRPKAMTSE